MNSQRSCKSSMWRWREMNEMNEMKWNDMTWHEMKWNKMKLKNNMKMKMKIQRNEMKWHKLKWTEMKWKEMKMKMKMQMKMKMRMKWKWNENDLKMKWTWTASRLSHSSQLMLCKLITAHALQCWLMSWFGHPPNPKILKKFGLKKKFSAY